MGNLPCIISMRPKCSHVLVVYLRISWNIPFREKYSYDFTRCIYKNAHSKDQTRDNRGVTKRACSTWFVATDVFVCETQLAGGFNYFFLALRNHLI